VAVDSPPGVGVGAGAGVGAGTRARRKVNGFYGAVADSINLSNSSLRCLLVSKYFKIYKISIG